MGDLLELFGLEDWKVGEDKCFKDRRDLDRKEFERNVKSSMIE